MVLLGTILLHIRFLTAQESAGDKVGMLIRRLRSERVEEREEAARGLLRMGKAVVPRLEGIRQDPDPEVAGRAREIIGELGRRERIEAVWPAPKRSTTILRETPLKEAVPRVFEPFGVTGLAALVPASSGVEVRRVTLDLREAALWPSLDELCRAGGLRLSAHHLVHGQLWFEDAGKEGGSPVHADAGDVRIWAMLSDLDREGEDGGGMNLRVMAGLIPGARPTSWTLTNVRVTDDRGREIPVGDPRGHVGIGMSRQPGFPTYVEAWKRGVKEKDLGGSTSVSVEGLLLLRHARDIERHEFDLERFEGPEARVIHGARITLERVEAKEDVCVFRYRCVDAGGGDPGLFLGWVEDREGRRLFDTGEIRSGPRLRTGGTASHTGLRGAARWVLARVAAEEEVRIPLRLPGISRPPVPRD